jgi:hypothetical protein
MEYSVTDTWRARDDSKWQKISAESSKQAAQEYKKNYYIPEGNDIQVIDSYGNKFKFSLDLEEIDNSEFDEPILEDVQKEKAPLQSSSPKDGGDSLWFKHYDKKIDALIESQNKTYEVLNHIRWMMIGFILVTIVVPFIVYNFL